MSDRQLFRQVTFNFAIGAALGAVFAAALLALDAPRLLEGIMRSGTPATTLIVLFCSVSAYFAFGAAITGFHFAIMYGDPETRG